MLPEIISAERFNGLRLEQTKNLFCGCNQDEGAGCFPNKRSMDNLFFKPHELAARVRKEKTGYYLLNINRLNLLIQILLTYNVGMRLFFLNDP
jgi:hypothetical protein